MYDPATGAIKGTCGLPCSMTHVPDPSKGMGQTRHAKNSLLWLQWLWRSSELPDPSRFLASTIGGDVCYGDAGTAYPVSGQAADCAPTSAVPGKPPAGGSAVAVEG